MPAYPLQLTALGVIVGSTLVASIFVVLRVYTRRKFHLKLGWDDWCVVAALLLSLGLVAPSWKHVKMWHLGIHIWEIPSRVLEPNYDEYYAVVLSFQLINIFILPLAKISIICLLLRASSVIPWLKKVLYGIMAFTATCAVIPWCFYIFICPPRTGNTWAPRTFGNLHCVGRHRMGEMLIWVTSANLLTDCLILPIPFIIVQRMSSARKRSRLVVIAVFFCGIAVTAISGVKISLCYRERIYAVGPLDWTYDISYCMSHIENNLAIVMANIPILRGLMARWIFNYRAGGRPRRYGIGSGLRWKSYQSAEISRIARRQRKMIRKMVPNAFPHIGFGSTDQGAFQALRAPAPVHVRAYERRQGSELVYAVDKAERLSMSPSTRMLTSRSDRSVEPARQDSADNDGTGVLHSTQNAAVAAGRAGE